MGSGWHGSKLQFDVWAESSNNKAVILLLPCLAPREKQMCRRRQSSSWLCLGCLLLHWLVKIYTEYLVYCKHWALHFTPLHQSPLIPQTTNKWPAIQPVTFTSNSIRWKFMESVKSSRYGDIVSYESRMHWRYPHVKQFIETNNNGGFTATKKMSQ